MNLINVLGIQLEQAVDAYKLKYANCQLTILAFTDSLLKFSHVQ